MGRISELSDELLIKILSFLPTKEAVSTCILSKQWEFLWMWLPKLEYISKGPVLRGSGSVLRDFIDKNLPLHRAPVIECLRLRLQLGRLQFKPEDVRLWVEIAVSRHVRELEVDFYPGNQNILPSSLLTCKSLVTLKLSNVMQFDPRFRFLFIQKSDCLESVSLFHWIRSAGVIPLSEISVGLWKLSLLDKILISEAALDVLFLRLLQTMGWNRNLQALCNEESLLSLRPLVVVKCFAGDLDYKIGSTLQEI